jgi:hypothetical protein
MVPYWPFCSKTGMSCTSFLPSQFRFPPSVGRSSRLKLLNKTRCIHMAFRAVFGSLTEFCENAPFGDRAYVLQGVREYGIHI